MEEFRDGRTAGSELGNLDFRIELRVKRHRYRLAEFLGDLSFWASLPHFGCSFHIRKLNQLNPGGLLYIPYRIISISNRIIFRIPHRRACEMVKNGQGMDAMSLSHFAEKLVALRKQHGLSQKEVAQHIHAKQPRISKLESQTADPSLEEAWRLARLFSVPMEYLADDSKVDPLELQLSLDERAIVDMARQAGGPRFLLSPRERNEWSDDELAAYFKSLALRYFEIRDDLSAKGEPRQAEEPHLRPAKPGREPNHPDGRSKKGRRA